MEFGLNFVPKMNLKTRQRVKMIFDRWVNGMFYKMVSLFLMCFQIYLNGASALEPSIHVLLATTGRTTLLQMLESLENQLEPSDYITVVFDAKDDGCVYERAAEKNIKFCMYRHDMHGTC